MNPDDRFNRFVTHSLVEELIPYQIYFYEDTSSWWWVDPQTKKWIIEVQTNGQYWIDKDWGFGFLDRMGLTPTEFLTYIETTIKRVLGDRINFNGIWMDHNIPFVRTPEINSPIIERVINGGVKKDLVI